MRSLILIALEFLKIKCISYIVQSTNFRVTISIFIIFIENVCATQSKSRFYVFDIITHLGNNGTESLHRTVCQFTIPHEIILPAEVDIESKLFVLSKAAVCDTCIKPVFGSIKESLETGWHVGQLI